MVWRITAADHNGPRERRGKENWEILGPLKSIIVIRRFFSVSRCTSHWLIGGKTSTTWIQRGTFNHDVVGSTPAVGAWLRNVTTPGKLFKLQTLRLSRTS